MKRNLIVITCLVSATVFASYLSNNASSSGITSLNSDTTAAQVIDVGTAGTDFAVSDSGATHTLNLPSASATARGVVTTGAQTLAGQKTLSSQPIFSAATASKVLVTDGSKILSELATTPTELNYLQGITVGNGTLLGGNGGKIITVAAGTSGQVLTAQANGSVAFATAAAGVTYPLQSDTDSEAAPSFSRSTDTNTGLWFPGADAISLAAGGKEVYRSTLTGGNTITTISGDTADAIDYNYHNLYIGNAFTGGYIGVYRIAQSSTVGWKFGSDQAVWGNNSFTIGANDVAKIRIKNNTTTVGISGSRINTTAGDAYTKPAILGGNLNGNVPANASPTATGANTTETDMYTYTLPASVIAQAGDAVELDAVGQFANNANNKTIKAYFGGTEILTTGAQAFGTVAVTSWHIRMKCYEDAATTGNNQVCWAEFTTDDTTATSKTITKVVKTTATYTAANVIKVTGTNGTASANDIVFFAGAVDYKPSGE